MKKQEIIKGFIDSTKHWRDKDEQRLKDDYDQAMWCAIADFTFRTVHKRYDSFEGGIAGLFDALCSAKQGYSLKDTFSDYFDKNPLKDEVSFDKWHNKTCQNVLAIINKYYETPDKKEIHYGKAQKIVNMTFKYLYCVLDNKDEHFRFCHIPLDSIILDWIWNNSTQMQKAFNSIKNMTDLKQNKITHASFETWSNLDYSEDLFCEKNNKIIYTYMFYQKLIRAYCEKKDYSPLQIEFVVWNQYQWERAAMELYKQSNKLLNHKLEKPSNAEALKKALLKLLNEEINELKLMEW